MAKYLVQAAYTAEGLQGLLKDKASGRREAVARAAQSLGGKVEAMYYALGDYDVALIIDVPDTVSGAAFALRASASGLVRTKTTALLTVEEVDQAVGKKVEYRAPGAS